MDAPHLRVAITTNSLINLDANFTAAKQVVFYDVTHDASEFVDVVPFIRGGQKGPGGGQGMASGCCMMDDMGDDDGTGVDPLVERVEALKDCSILFTMGLSDLAAMRVHDLQVFPVKCERPHEIDELVGRLQNLMKDGAPLWLRRVLRGRDGQRIDLDDQEV
jgi:nitrogen fixation protein NifX